MSSAEMVRYEDPQEQEEVIVLHERASDEVAVELLYAKLGGRVLVHLVDFKEEQDLTFPVPNDKAMDAFKHPYAYYGRFLAGQRAA